MRYISAQESTAIDGMDRTVDFVHGILMDWAGDREMLIGKQ